jgi:hypothetical protein
MAHTSCAYRTVSDAMNPQPGMREHPPAPVRRGILRHDGDASHLTYAFNPTVLRTDHGLTVLLRAVDAKGTRRIFRYATDDSLNPSSIMIDWTDEIRRSAQSLKWIADPRAFCHNGRRYITFNSGHSERPNNIYVVEIDEDGRPIAPPKAAILEGKRRLIEKNWGFFEHDETLYAIYSLVPLIILECRFRDDQLLCRPAYRHAWKADHLETAFGPLHGGASPVRIDDRIIAAFQSRSRTDNGFVYTGNLIAIEGRPPFRPLASGTRPLFTLMPDEQIMQPPGKLNDRVSQCFYPSGLLAGRDRRRLLLTYGINDYRCGYREYWIDELDAHLFPVTVHALSDDRNPAVFMGANAVEAHTPPLLRSFYWKPPRTNSPSPEALSAARFQFGNFGDTMQCHINAALFGTRTRHVETEGYRLLGAGSIAHRARRGDIIWGSGFKENPLPLSAEDKETIEVRAVRGPLTADYLSRNGVDTTHISWFFDPGLLIGEIFADQISRCRALAGRPDGILLIPHYKDTLRFQTSFVGRGYRIRSVDCDLFEMVTAILGAELVISTSLHGIILAEALHVPAILMSPPASEPFTKYQDYYSGTLRDRFPVIDDPKHAISARIPPTPSIPGGWRDSLPSLADLLARGIAVPARSLDAPAITPVSATAPRSWDMHFDIGRYSGDSFLLDIEMDSGLATRLRVADDASIICDLQIEPDKSIVTLELDGEAIEAHGNIISLTLAAGDAAKPITPRKVSARFTNP